MQRASGGEHVLRFDGSWTGWRSTARAALHAGLEPARVAFRSAGDVQHSLLGDDDSCEPRPSSATAHPVPRSFLAVGADVACHRNASRWDTLYRVLWRVTHGERGLLEVYVDDDIHALCVMAKAVRREGHKMRAFVRFRRVVMEGEADRYVAWFEPELDVVQREAPFFARRFPAMHWSILTPSVSAHWLDGVLSFGDGVSRLDAPRGDDLECLWRTYYAHTFNPARARPKAMRAEMPVRYWKHLPEASLIAPLLRDAPARVSQMIERQRAAAERPGGPRPERMRPVQAHDEGVAMARARSDRAREVLEFRGHTPAAGAVSHANVRVGTASWTDPTMTAPRVFYPDSARTAASRLAYYASRFSLVEVDSTYYALPSAHVASLWAERTPHGFVFDVKAHALMTGHSASVARLPEDIRAALPAAVRGSSSVRTRDLPDELVSEVWRRFLSALQPLRDAGKLGALLLQLPRDCAAAPEPERDIARCRERAGADLCAIEFRHASWVEDGARRARTLDMCRMHDLAFVMVDGPSGFRTSMPPMTAVTSDRLAVVRMHGRRRETWETPVDTVSERYRYLYDAAELGEWVPRIIDVAQRTQGVHVVMNNCHANYGTANGDEITALLIEADLERRNFGRVT